MTSMKKRIATTLTAATLTIGLTIPATAADMFGESIRVSSYKGTTLKVGERSGLIIGPNGVDYTVTSGDPDTVVEQVLTFWGAVAKAEGSLETTASNSTEECGSMTLTVNSTSIHNQIRNKTVRSWPCGTHRFPIHREKVPCQILRTSKQ